jgi:hypothetical protein
MITYTIERCREKSGYHQTYGYRIRRDPPTVQTHDDVEGVGWCPITPIAHHYVGWYKYRCDAERRLAELRMAEQAVTP